MASLIGPKTDLALAEEAAKAGSEIGVCVVANDNNNGNVVISGAKAAVDKAIEKAKELGARAIPLNVSAPFHCPLMQPAADEMAAALGDRDNPGRPARRWWPMSRPARPSTPKRSAGCWSSRSPAGCAGARAWNGWPGRAGSPASPRPARQGPLRHGQAHRPGRRGDAAEHAGGPGSVREEPVIHCVVRHAASPLLTMTYSC